MEVDLHDPDAPVLQEDRKSTIRRLSRGYVYAMFAPWIGSLCLGNSVAYGVSAERSLQQSGTALPFVFGEDQVFWFVFFLDTGAIAGCLLGGIIIQTVGRIRTLRLCAISFSLGWLCIVLTRTILVLYVGRIFNGFSCGLAALCAPVYVAEVVRADFRSFFGGCLHAFFSLGALVSFIGGRLLSWRYLALVSCLPAGAMLLVVRYAVESPYWLYHVGRSGEALETLCHLRRHHGDAKEEYALMETRCLSGRTSIRAALCAVLVFCIRQTCGYGYMVTKSPKFIRPLIESLEVLNVSITVGLLQLILAVTAVFLMDLTGRRPLLFISAATTIISDFFIGLVNLFPSEEEGGNVLARLSVALMGVFVIGYSLGLGPIPGILAAELVPPMEHGVLTGVVFSSNWVVHYTVKLFFQKAFLSEYLELWIAAVITAVELGVAMMLLPETGRLRLADIGLLYEGAAKTPAPNVLGPWAQPPSTPTRMRSPRKFSLQELAPSHKGKE